MVDFNTIYGAITPYVGTGVIGLGLTVILLFAIYFSKFMQKSKIEIKALSKTLTANLQKVLPEDLTISLEAMSKTAFAEIESKLENIIQEKFINQIKANTEITYVIAKALACSKLIPDEYKEQIKELLSLSEVPTDEKLKISLIPTIPEVKQEKKKVEIIEE